MAGAGNNTMARRHLADERPRMAGGGTGSMADTAELARYIRSISDSAETHSLGVTAAGRYSHPLRNGAFHGALRPSGRELE